MLNQPRTTWIALLRRVVLCAVIAAYQKVWPIGQKVVTRSLRMGLTLMPRHGCLIWLLLIVATVRIWFLVSPESYGRPLGFVTEDR